MTGIRINPDARKIIFTVPAVVPPRDMRHALHRLLDEALDSFLPSGGAEPPRTDAKPE